MSKNRNYYRSAKVAKRRLRRMLVLFLLVLSLPVYFLLDRVYSQLENEAYFRLNHQAQIVVEQIDDRLLALIDREQARPIAEYSFFNVLESTLLQSSGVKFSPLSTVPPDSDIPGLAGYFQIDPDGSFRIPQLPAELNNHVTLSTDELASRIVLKNRLRDLLAVNETQPDKRPEAAASLLVDDKRLAKSQAPAAKQGYRFDEVLPLVEQDNASKQKDKQDAFEQHAAGKKTAVKLAEKTKAVSEQVLGELNIDADRFRQNNQKAEAAFSRQRKLKTESRYASRKEIVKLPQQSMVDDYLAGAQQSIASVPYPAEQEVTGMMDANVQAESNEQPSVLENKKSKDKMSVAKAFSFESEVGPLQLLMLDQSLCFFRQVWHQNSRYIQGFIVDRDGFFNAELMPMINSQQASGFSSLLLAYKGQVINHFKGVNVERENLIHRSALTPPFQNFEVIVNTVAMSTGSEAIVVDILAVSLMLIIIVGLLMFYRLGAGQIELAGRQRNFISAVSHELKTPLTSIRMYGEMLRSDWVIEEGKKRRYYDYIFFESERLSRLINNVLQLAKLENNQEQVSCHAIAPVLLLKRLGQQINLQIESSEFELKLVPDTKANDFHIRVDEDAMTQIMINLVDNAIKFASAAEHKVIDMGYRYSSSDNTVSFFVRDYGSGIEKQQMKKIFQLFYRSGDEMTRTQPGTGIGLALIVQLAESMNASVDLINRDPGAEFQIKFESAT